MLITYITVFLALIFLIIYVYFQYQFTTWRNKNVPYLEPSFPFGNSKQFAVFKESFGDHFRRLYNDLKRKSSYFGGIYIFSNPVILLIDPELIKCVLTKDFKNFHDRGMFVDEDCDPLRSQLVTLKGWKWRTSRAKISPTFTSGKLKSMFHTILETSKELGNVLDQNKNIPLDSKDLFARQATDAIGSFAFGLECNSLKDPNNEFRVYSKKFFEFGFQDAVINALATNCPRFLRFLKIPQTSPNVTAFFMNIVKQTVQYREKNNIQRKDFLDLLIRLKNNQNILDESVDIKIAKENEEGMTFKELAASAFVFFIAGYETISTTLNFCLYELVENIDIQEKARKEVLFTIEKYDGQITYDAITEMKYLDKIFLEVLRKYPPIPILQRECTEDYKIPNTDITIKKGTDIIIPTLGLQRDPEHYPNPDKFDPDRFDEDQKSQRHPFTFLSFGEGPRICIGMRYALIQFKIVLAVMLMDFKFKLDSKTITPIVFDTNTTFLTPKDLIWLQAERIQK